MKDVQRFVGDIKKWAEGQNDIQAVFLVGSHARGEAHEDSDVDLVLLTDQPSKYLEDGSFLKSYGEIARVDREVWGRLTSLRVWYQDGLEVDLGISTPDWITERPLDAGTFRVISDGAKVLVDRMGGLEELALSVKKER